MLTVVPNQMLSARSTPVVLQVSLLILLIILIAAGGTFAYVHSIRTQRRQLFRLAYEDPLTRGDNFACFKEKMLRHNVDRGFYVALDIQQLSDDRLMEDAFEDALKNGEFQLWYQPKVEPAGGNILGAEALIRWKRPDGTMLSSGKFIPLFEKNGNITTLMNMCSAQYVHSSKNGCRRVQRCIQSP